MAPNKPAPRLAVRQVLTATLVSGVFAMTLVACGSMSDKINPFKKEEVKLPGERIAVLKSQDAFKIDETTAKKAVRLPPARSNTEWSQPGGTPSNAPVHVQFSGGLGAVWQASIGAGSSDSGRLTASPIVYDGKIYTIDAEGVVSAFSASGGSRIWQVSLAPENEGGDEGYGGGLAANGGRIFVTTGYGVVAALNAGTGAVEWTRRIGVPLRSSPTAINGKVFFVSADSKLHCLSTVDGVELWTYRGLPESASLLNNASPAIDGKTVVVPYPSGEIIAYSTDGGRPAWADSLSRSESGASLATLADPARPVIDRGVVYAVGNSGRMIATAQKSGERLWTKKIRGTQMPWAAGDLVYVVDVNGVLLALTRQEGKVRWLTELPQAKKWSGPVLAGGKLWLASSTGVMVSVDVQTGSVLSQRELDSSISIAPVVASGRMYVLTDKARLVALN